MTPKIEDPTTNPWAMADTQDSDGALVRQCDTHDD